MPKVILTHHAQLRLHQRGIDAHEAIQIAKKGLIIQIGFDGTIIKIGTCSNGGSLKVIYKMKGATFIIKTIYFL